MALFHPSSLFADLLQDSPKPGKLHSKEIITCEKRPSCQHLAITARTAVAFLLSITDFAAMQCFAMPFGVTVLNQ